MGTLTSWENTTADILVEYLLQPPLDMVTVDQELEQYKPNSITTCYLLLLLLNVPTNTMLSKVSEHPYLVAIVYSIHIGSTTASFNLEHYSRSFDS